jgi:trehalose 6-phosphate synthase/phosphatase
MTERLLVVSNRLPMTLRRTAGTWHAERSSGGLVAALGPLMADLEGLWLGSPGDAGSPDDRERAALLATWEREHRLAAVELPASVGRAFYEGYSNNTLWPLLHGFPTRAVFDPATWHAYRDANERFVDATVARHRAGDLVWIHDYQLLLTPELLRAALPDARIGFFLHIPFPASESFRILPEREEILRGLLGADLVAFQTHAHLNDFRRALLEILGVDSQMDRVPWDGRTVWLAALPIGIVTTEWERLAGADASVARRVRDLRGRNVGRQLILAVDRLDYTKGIPERLRAFRRLLVRTPEWRGRASLIQVAVPSRERIRSYAELRREVSELVGEINGELGTPEWNPVVYLRRSIGRNELAALYAAADIAWVAPLRDGMNLVAKEYVACQLGGRGVLVISEFAGAAQEMGEAIRVNPYDEEGTAEAIDRALRMPDDERRERQAALLARVRRNDARAWGSRFVGTLRDAAAERASEVGVELPGPPIDAMRAAVRTASRRDFYVDYDGTLVAIAQRPADAVPTTEALEVLERLAADEANRVVVVSGRSADDLAVWFDGLPRLWLVAEHGALVRDPKTGTWRPLRPGADSAWKSAIRPILEAYADRAPGSFVEEKTFALAWHHRLADPEFGEWLANELVSLLDRQLAGTELVVLRGHKVVEVRLAWANKGQAVAQIRSLGPRPEVEVAIGDDRTDEDLFARLPKRAWTIRVGHGASRARHRVADHRAALALLAALAELGAAKASRRRRASRASRSGSRSP